MDEESNAFNAALAGWRRFASVLSTLARAKRDSFAFPTQR
jgi:hypothetical protein